MLVWEDGTAVSTVNHAHPRIFAPLPRVRQVQAPGASVASAVARHREVLAHQERCGILRRRGADYGFTWRGAWRSNVRIWRGMRAAKPRARAGASAAAPGAPARPPA
jgi:hypothetical protein